MVSFPNAKINIGLSITEKRPDGYHNLESVFVPVGWSDVLEILPATQTSFKSTGISIPGNHADNLCLKAYTLLSRDFELPAVSIHLHKVVPIGAGLGGGSSDAAFTLKMLNDLFELNLSAGQLENYARLLGSDCAFFIKNKVTFCFGKGDEFSEISFNLAGKSILLVYPDIHSSTAEAYSGIIPKKTAVPLQKALAEPIINWKHTVHNDFEESLFPKHPFLAQIKKNLYQAGASYASLSGSGSTVYGIFEQKAPTSLFPDLLTWSGSF
ncbi:MAG: 4-(cytidine 5'-diphospho)-2-C-methyl-D-erythritol kinase [Siphonobacter sp.]